MKERGKLIFRAYAVIIAATMVINRSLRARPKMRAAWTPSPGTPNTFAYGQGISIKT